MNVLRWLGKQFFTILFVCLITMTTTFVVINTYTQHILSSIGVNLDESKLTFSRFLAHFTGQANIINDRIELDETSLTYEETDLNDVALSLEDEDHVKEDVEEGTPGTETEEWKTEEVLEVWGQQQGHHIIFSMEEFEEKKDQLSGEDKMRIFAIVIENIPPHEVQKLSAMMEEGITIEELQDIEAMFGHYLNEEDYDELMAMIDF